MEEHVVGAAVRIRRTPPPEFARTLAAARRRTEFGVRAAARAAGISPSYLSRLERGFCCPSRTVAEQLVAALKVKGKERATLLAAAVDDAGRDHPARKGSVPAA